MGEKTKLTRKYQITIPTKIRKNLKLKAGDYLHMEVENGQVIIRPIPKSYTDYMAGLGEKVWKILEGEKFVKKERASWKR